MTKENILKPRVTSDYSRTKWACYLGFVTQAITANFAPLLFVMFHRQYGIPLSSLALIPAVFYVVQLCVDFLCAKFPDIDYRRSIVLSEVTSAAGLLGLVFLPDCFANPLVGILVCVTLYAVGSGLIEVLCSPIIEACPFPNKESMMSLLHSFYCWGAVGVILGSTLFFSLFGVEHWRWLAAVWSLVPLLNIYNFSTCPIEPIVREGESKNMGQLFRVPVFWLFFLLMIAAGASESSMAQWTSAFAEASLHVDKATGDLEHTFDMKWKEGSGLKEFSAESKCDKLKFNREYTAQVSMDSGYGYVVPIEDIYLLTQVPNIKVFDMEIVQTATPKKAATYEELQNRTIVGQHPTTGELAWMFKNKAYRYRYKIDIMLEIEAPRLIKKWGLHLGDIYANSTEFEHKEKDKKSVFLMPTVRMTWYANSSSVSLYAYPFAQIQDENGNVSKDLKKYESWSGVVNYQEFLDKPFSMTDEQPNYEKSRTATSWDANPVDFSFDPEASDFEIEYITE